MALVWLLKTNFVRQQLLLNNIGIAYPAISEQTCPRLVLPAKPEEVASLSLAAKRFSESQLQLEQARCELIS
jgi:hypothetical protein